MARAPSPPLDPAADAAALLRRLGFATLMLALPVTALVTRRGIVVLAPIGIILLVIAAALDGANKGVRDSAKGVFASWPGLAAGLVLLWCAVSLFWTPFVGPASERFLNLVATVAAALAGYFALPERMRSANLYIVPVGTALAAVAAILIALFGVSVRGAEEDGQSLERGLVVLVLVLWPSVAWLRSRGRTLESLLLALVVAAAAALGPQPMPLIALALGALAYGLTAAAPAIGARVTAFTVAGLLALAPLIPFIARPIAAAFLDPASPSLRSLTLWRRIVESDPLRLITGHGFETALRGRFAGLLPLNAPNTLLFEIWYDLGIVAAWAGAVALFFAIQAAAREAPPLVPGIMAAFASAFTFACLGLGIAQMWWFTALAVVVLIFVAAERGQFRTSRPKASLLRAANDR
jgi:hypothetical protein